MGYFEYEALDTLHNEIRLLQILPGKETDEIRCTLFHKPLASNSYIALSYSWTDHYLFRAENLKETEKLFVNDRAFILIGKNLASYLRHARREDEQTGSLWVDAICINQNDIKERGVQVLGMREIYGLARNVVVWLGHEADDSASALQFIKRIGKSSHSDSDLRTQRDLAVPRESQFNWWEAKELA